MDLSAINNFSLDQGQFSGLLEKSSSLSDSLLSGASNFSIQQILMMVVGLVLFRSFGFMIFSILSLLGIMVSSIVSVCCNSLSLVIKLATKTINTALGFFGNFGSGLIESSSSIVSFVLFKTKSIMIPAVASMLCSFFYLQGDSLASEALDFIGINPKQKISWVKFEEKSTADGLEQF